MTDDLVVERMARAMAVFFTHNCQPDMSSDPMAKLLPHQKRDCFDAARNALEAIRPGDDLGNGVVAVKKDEVWPSPDEFRYMGGY